MLNDKGEVLMIRRKVSKTGINGSVLQWTFPGGKQRLNETREECVKREVLIETGYDIEPIKYISLRLRSKFPVTIIYHLCVLKSKDPITKPKKLHAIAEIKWIKPKDIK